MLLTGEKKKMDVLAGLTQQPGDVLQLGSTLSVYLHVFTVVVPPAPQEGRTISAQAAVRPLATAMALATPWRDAGREVVDGARATASQPAPRLHRIALLR